MPDKYYTLKADQPTPSVDARLSFLVKGSASEPYQVVFSKKGSNLTAHCTCPAGLVGQYCRHRLDILKGDVAKLKIVSDNVGQVALVAQWVPGSDVEKALDEVDQAQRAADAATEELKKRKKKLARALMD